MAAANKKEADGKRKRNARLTGCCNDRTSCVAQNANLIAHKLYGFPGKIVNEPFLFLNRRTQTVYFGLVLPS